MYLNNYFRCLYNGSVELQLYELLSLNVDIRLKFYADIIILSHFDIIHLSELLYGSDRNDRRLRFTIYVRA